MLKSYYYVIQFESLHAENSHISLPAANSSQEFPVLGEKKKK